MCGPAISESSTPADKRAALTRRIADNKRRQANSEQNARSYADQVVADEAALAAIAN